MAYLSNLQKINLTSSDLEQIDLIFEDLNLSYGAFLFCILTTDDSDLIIQYIVTKFEELNIDWCFPYPKYIQIQPESTRVPGPNYIESLKDIPRHFIVKNKAPSVKEAAIINLIKKTESRIQKHKIGHYKKNVKDYATKHKELFKLTSYGEYLENLSDKVLKIK